MWGEKKHWIILFLIYEIEMHGHDSLTLATGRIGTQTDALAGDAVTHHDGQCRFSRYLYIV